MHQGLDDVARDIYYIGFLDTFFALSDDGLPLETMPVVRTNHPVAPEA